MLQTIKANSLDELCEETIPASIRLQGQMNLPDAMSEANCVQHIAALSSKNKVHKSSAVDAFKKTRVRKNKTIIKFWSQSFR